MMPVRYLQAGCFIPNAFLTILRISGILFLTGATIISVFGQIPDGFIREQMATGLNPTSLAVAPDGRLFVTEKHGVIRIIRDDILLERPFLTLEVDDSNERGLGHMVFHPQFEQNGYYYVFYSVPGLRFNRISRFTANGDQTIPGSEVIILDLDQLGSDIHNGGDMVFGFDGYLYIGTGDGGQNWRGEDLGSTNGKILRVTDAGEPVADNPWFDLGYLRCNLVYAYGFRNPFTVLIHPHTGEIYANDVGGSKYEEVNKIQYGGFYGWPTVEGKRTIEVVPDEYRDPVFQYAHQNNYCAIVGAVFYAPQVQQFPDTYAGRYFYSDYCTGRIRTLDPETWQDKGTFISDGDRVIDLDISADGSLYYLERKGLGDGSPDDNTGTNNGVLWKVSYTGSGAPFISVQPQSVLSAIGEDATFTVAASGAAPLTYSWFIDGVEEVIINSSTLTLSNISLDQDSTTIVVVVSNEEGAEVSEKVLLRVTSNHRPDPKITTPVSGTTYKAGEVISFSGFADDIEDGVLSGSGLSWKVDFHHGTHSHPGMSWTQGISSGEWAVPILGETSIDVWYRFYLKATDSEGFSKIVYQDVFPETGEMLVDAQPSGLLVSLDGVAMITPYEVDGVQGVNRYITPPFKQVFGDSIYFFKEWENGSVMPNREIRTTSDVQEFKASFEGIRQGKGVGLTAHYYDNPQFNGEPIVVAIDSILDHQYLLNSPYAGVPEDNFGIIWKGYLQAFNTGWYNITVFADDGVYIAINDMEVINNWEAGVHHETDSIFLETGRLYPILIRHYDYLYGAQLRLRWSSSDFPEEVIPSSQLYPADYLSDDRVSGIVILKYISNNQLMMVTESYQDVELVYSIIATNGITVNENKVRIGIGKNELPIDISFLPSGMYYLCAIDAESGTQTITPFIKAN